MNIVLLHPAELPATGQVLLTERRAEHIHRVIQPKPGDNLRVGVVNGQMGLAEVLHCTDKQVALQVTLNQPAPAPLPVTLLLAMPRPKVLRRLLQSITALGVKQIYLTNSYRVEKSYWQTPFLEADAIQEQLLLGLEQGRDTLLPEVHQRKRFKPFVEDELPALLKGKQGFLAHPTESALPCPSNQQHDSLLAIGPEGGFIAYEVEKLEQAGFQTISLGQRILKVETAVPALLSKLFL